MRRNDRKMMLFCLNSKCSDELEQENDGGVGQTMIKRKRSKRSTGETFSSRHSKETYGNAFHDEFRIM